MLTTYKTDSAVSGRIIKVSAVKMLSIFIYKSRVLGTDGVNIIQDDIYLSTLSR